MENCKHWGWRQNLSWRLGFGRAQAGCPYSCPWWADKRIYGLAYLHGKAVPPSEEAELPPSPPQALPDPPPTVAAHQESPEAE